MLAQAMLGVVGSGQLLHGQGYQIEKSPTGSREGSNKVHRGVSPTKKNARWSIKDISILILTIKIKI